MNSVFRREEKQYSINKAETTLTYNDQEDESYYVGHDNKQNNNAIKGKETHVPCTSEDCSEIKIHRRQKNHGSRKTSSSFSFSNKANLV